jgi:protein-S-isoprenylcysteine O-methyltransferase Ste14
VIGLIILRKKARIPRPLKNTRIERINMNKIINAIVLVAVVILFIVGLINLEKFFEWWVITLIVFVLLGVLVQVVRVIFK